MASESLPVLNPDAHSFPKCFFGHRNSGYIIFPMLLLAKPLIRVSKNCNQLNKPRFVIVFYKSHQRKYEIIFPSLIGFIPKDL